MMGNATNNVAASAVFYWASNLKPHKNHAAAGTPAAPLANFSRINAATACLCWRKDAISDALSIRGAFKVTGF